MPSRRSRRARRTSPSRSRRVRTSRRRDRGVVPCFAPRRRTNLEGFLFPATYDFFATTPSRSLVADQLDTFCENWRSVDLSYAKSKNLTPYDVLKIASMVEKETLAPSERRLVAAVIYNRLHARMPLGIDATLRYGLHIPPTQSILESQLQSDNPYNSRKVPGPAADPDREPRARVDPGCGAPGEGRLPLLRPQAGQGAPLLHGQRHRLRAVRVRARLRVMMSRRAPRPSGRALALAADAERRVRGARARLALRGVRRRGSRRRGARRCVTLGFAGANVTIPHKQAVVAACDEADGDAVNTLVFRDGRVLGLNTDREILSGIVATRACVIGAGGAARDARARAAGGHARLQPPRRLAAGRDRLRPDRERDAGSRRGARRARSRADRRRPRLRAAARRRSSRPPARPAARWSTGSRRSCARARRASSSGPGVPRRVDGHARGRTRP